MALKVSSYLFDWFEKTNRKLKILRYLDIFGKLIIGEDTERCKVTDRVELEDDLNGLPVARVITPSNPTYNGQIVNVKRRQRRRRRKPMKKMTERRGKVNWYLAFIFTSILVVVASFEVIGTKFSVSQLTESLAQ